MGDGRNKQREPNPFKIIVKNNLQYWIRRYPWEKMPDVAELAVEKENIIKAIQTGIRFKSVYYLAVHLLFISTDIMLHVGTHHQWARLIEQALERCPANGAHLRRRLQLCQAKHLFLDEEFEKLNIKLTEWAGWAEKDQDADLLWEFKYLLGMVRCELDNFAEAQECVDDIVLISESFTLLNPHLCKGKIATLGAKIAVSQQHLEQSTYLLDLALHHLQKCGADFYLAIALQLSGLFYEKQQKFDAALVSYRQAVELIPEGFSFELRSSLQASTARIYLIKKQVDLAQSMLEEMDFGMMRIWGCHHIHLEAVLLLSDVMRMKGANDQADLILESVETLRAELSESTKQ